MIGALRNNDIHGISKCDDIVNYFDQIVMSKELDMAHRARMNELRNQYRRYEKLQQLASVESLVSEIISIGIFNQGEQDKLEKVINSALEIGYTLEKSEEIKKYVIQSV